MIVTALHIMDPYSPNVFFKFWKGILSICRSYRHSVLDNWISSMPKEKEWRSALPHDNSILKDLILVYSFFYVSEVKQKKSCGKLLGYVAWTLLSEVMYRCPTLVGHGHSPYTCRTFKSKVSYFFSTFFVWTLRGHNKKSSRHWQNKSFYWLKRHPSDEKFFVEITL